MNVSEVMVQYLKAAGIGNDFGYPGDPSIEFTEAAPCSRPPPPFIEPLFGKPWVA